MTGGYDRDAAMAALLKALPYIRLYKGRTFVIKLGGAGSSDPVVLRQLADQVGVLRELGIRVVLVHGGGPQATALSQRLGIETQMIEGRRVTSPRTLEAVVMAINGTVSTAILAACRAIGLPAIGLSGVDAGLVRARVRPPVVKDLGDGPVEVSFGEVGDICEIDAAVLERLLAANFLPVIASVAADDNGRVLNINADTVAARVASALEAEKLIFVTSTPGLLEDPADPGSLISYIDLPGLAEMEADGALHDGMLPKVAATREALAGGVQRVHVVGFRERWGLLVEIFTNDGSGTLIVRSIADLAPAEHAAPSDGAAAGSAG